MLKSVYFFCICLFMAAAPVAAQRVPRLPKNPKIAQEIPIRVPPPRAITPPLNKLPVTISHMAKLPALDLPRVTAIQPEAPIRSAVLPLRETVITVYGLKDPFTATAFVIEEEFEGKKYLWGVTAAHIAHLMDGFAAVYPEQGLPAPVEFTGLGNPDMDDIALFPLTEDWPQLFGTTPLKLADEMPKPGEKTYSFGYFNNGFFLVPNREVKEITPKRLITSMEFEKLDRAGACGGPILDKQGRVVGVHVGSSSSNKISFGVPVSEIKRLLKAYRNQGKDLQNIFFNGAKLAQININESIELVRTFKDNRMTGEFFSHHKEKMIDYNHLETLPVDQNPDRIQLFISHKPFSFGGTDRTAFYFKLTYDFTTGEITRTKITEIPS